jgi:hypothetical protein
MLAYFYMDNRLSVSQFDLIIFEDIIALYLKTLQVCLLLIFNQMMMRSGLY